ncbi:DUF4342 domain-containing protein [Actinomyces sp. 2119]|uniref:DUF4342 domain-containing protein n=1 Tax=Actinomyces sp. 2119 TaxID=2321393 RepID=UPI000E6C6FDF|nr:DUF4342 domain-containing protein [Actinomyces sp. 2119]RJF40412.1 DUF4342 domain-containing protein [Actinomyces sp. 2119]
MTTQKTPKPGAGEPGQQSGTTSQPSGSHTVLEWIDVAGDQLVSTVRRLMADGSVRRVVLRDSSGRELFSIPMTAGVIAGGVTVVAAPVLAAVGVVAAMVTRVTLEVERTSPGSATGAADPGPTGGGEKEHATSRC